MGEFPFFPMFVDLSRRRALVVGGGRIAARRVNTLAQFCPDITVVAPAIHPGIAALVDGERVKALERAFAMDDLNGADLVLACTDDPALNADIARACRDRCILVNNASDRGTATSCSPASPVAAKWWRASPPGAATTPLPAGPPRRCGNAWSMRSTRNNM